MPAAAAISAATLGSAALSVGAANNASDAATAAADKNLNFIKGVYTDAGTNLSPTIHQGTTAGDYLAGLLGIGGDPAASQRAFDTFRNSTNYNFLLDQGTQAVKTANAPSFNSGATAKALLNYGQGMAGNALAGYEGLLAGQQQLGTHAALGLGSIGVGQSGQFVNANNSLAGALGSAGIYGANAGGGALQGLASLFKSNQTASSFANGAGGIGSLPSSAGDFSFNLGG